MPFYEVFRIFNNWRDFSGHGKLRKLGMDTKSVIARFEAERQALALMDHPNIAKVHDAERPRQEGPISSWNWCAA